MLIRTGQERTGEADRQLAWSLAGIAGALNAAGFYAVALYSSNMTGNVSAFADHLALADLRGAATYLGLLAAFILGAAVSAMLVSAGRRHRIVSIYAFSILAEAALLAGLAAADLWLANGARGPLLAYGLSFLMGLQNAVVTRISNARVRTTHVTGMFTDIGIELGNLADLAWRRSRYRHPDEAIAFNSDNLRLHGCTVASFLVGGVIGVLCYKSLGAYFLFGVSVLLFALGAAAITKQRSGGLSK